MFFHSFCYKNSCFNELVYDCVNLMICSFKLKNDVLILKMICTDHLNCLKSVITTEKGQSSLKVIFSKQFLTKPTIFRCFDICSVRPPQIFQVKAKMSTVRALLPHQLYISYDYGLQITKATLGKNCIFFRMFVWVERSVLLYYYYHYYYYYYYYYDDDDDE